MKMDMTAAVAAQDAKRRSHPPYWFHDNGCKMMLAYSGSKSKIVISGKDARVIPVYKRASR